MIIKRNKEFSLWNKFLTWADKYNASKGCYSNYSGNMKPPIPQSTIKRQQEEEEKKKAIDSISPYHKALRIAFENANKFSPDWGDGDEYPYFGIYQEDSEWNKMGDIYTEFQNPWEYRYGEKGWLLIEDPRNLIRSPKKIFNLKQELLRVIKIYKEDYKDSHIKYDWTEQERDDVLNYLDHLEQEIKKSRL